MLEGGRDTLLHVAGRFGHVLQAWRRRRAVAKQDAFVEAWKAAWSEGCHRRWQGVPRDAAPQEKDGPHEAWLAGWQWADAHPQWADPHPDRRGRISSLNSGHPPGTDRRARWARGARRGVAGLTLLAVAGWWWRRRGAGRLDGTSSPEQPD